MQNFIASHDLTLVALSYAISVIGAFISLYLADYISDRKSHLSVGWVAMAALVFGGCSVWAMHFVGMLAYQMNVPATYDVALTLASIAIPVAFSGVALYIAFRWKDSVGAWLAAGTVLGLGIASMHYIGMAAMRVPMAMTHDATITAASIGIAIVAATAALRILVHWTGGKRLLSPLIVGLAVCGMHYTAMTGMTMVPLIDGQSGVNYFEGAWTEQTMAFLAGLGVALTLFIGAALSAFMKMAELQDSSDSFAGA